MECLWCGTTSIEEKLYRCGFNNCPHSDKVLCTKCGERVHHKINDHNFASTKKVTGIHHSPPMYIEQKSNLQSHPQSHPQSHHESIDELKSEPKSEPKSQPKSQEIVNVVTGIASSLHGFGVLTSCVGQVIYATSKYKRKEIVDENGNKDKAELNRLVGRALVVPTASCGMSVGGVKLISFASLSSPIIWTAFIGYGILGEILSRKMFDKYLPERSQQRKELKWTAIRIFQFFEDDLTNPDIFNKGNIEKRYKKLAKLYHPDRTNGNDSKFKELEVYHRIILSMLDDDTVFPMVQFDENGKAYIDSTTAPKAICASTSPATEKPQSNKWFNWW